MDTFDIVRQTDALISADPLRSVGLGGAGGCWGKPSAKHWSHSTQPV